MKSTNMIFFLAIWILIITIFMFIVDTKQNQNMEDLTKLMTNQKESYEKIISEQNKKINKLENDLDKINSNLEDLKVISLPITDFTFYAGNEPTSGNMGASGKELTHGTSIALNKPLMEEYGLTWGDTIVVESKSHPEITGVYILEDCGVGRNDTADGYVQHTSYIPSWGRATDLNVWAVKEV